MADLKISEFEDGGPITPSDEVATVRAGVNTKVFTGSMASEDADDYTKTTDFGTAAFAATGSGSSQVPTNSILGDLAYQDTVDLTADVTGVLPAANGGYTDAAGDYWIFVADGTFTTPADSTTATVYEADILAAGGGGGGSNGAGAVGGGAGAGHRSVHRFSGIAASTNVSITVGAAGTAGSSAGSDGGDGGNSSIGSPVTITSGGGKGGKGSTAAGGTGTEGGDGGTLVAGSPNILSADGRHGGRGWSTGVGTGVAGEGADSDKGGGGIPGSLNVAQAPRAATGYGSGGAGGFLATTAGGAGRPGYVKITRITQ